jgi:CheY-like chemotaxis protein
MTIVYVDDDQEDAEIFCEAIKVVDSAITCKVIHEAKKVIEEINLICPDYIFLDFRMPKMDGKDVLLQIKDHDCFKKTKVIMYSTYMFEKDIEDCKNLGVHGCWKKSAEFTSLCNDLRSLLKKSN